MKRVLTPLVAMVALALLAPAVSAAAKPGVKTGAAADVQQSTVTLTGRVDPNGAATVYFFQYGATSLYGAQTAETAAGAGKRARTVTAAITALAPATRYHYRLVARNASGLVKGADRTFRTKPQPLGVTLGANPPAVVQGAATTLGGQLTGTNNAGRQVLLQANPFPYTQGFVNAGNPQVTDAAGNFAFPVLALPVTTQYRVLMPQRPEVVSPIVTVGALLRLSTTVRRTRLSRRSVRLRFFGRVAPVRNGAPVRLQKLKNGIWYTVKSSYAKPRSSTDSRYYLKLRVRHSGRYRILVEASGDLQSRTGRELTIGSVRRG